MSRSISAIWCDDIRFEVGNKQSLMGIYNGQMMLPSLPLTLAKLCIHFDLRTSINNPFTQLRVVVLKDDAVFAEIDLSDTLAQQEQIKEFVNHAEYINVGSVFMFSPVVFEDECIFRVKAFTEDGELSGQGLWVRHQKEEPLT